MRFIGGIILVADTRTGTRREGCDEPSLITGGTQGLAEVAHVGGDRIVADIFDGRSGRRKRGSGSSGRDPAVWVGIGFTKKRAIAAMRKTSQLHIARWGFHIGLVGDIFAGQRQPFNALENIGPPGAVVYALTHSFTELTITRHV